MEIYLIRHTKVDVADGVCYGQSDVGLATSFPKEAGEILESLPDVRNYYCYASPLTRCKSLAETLKCKELKIDSRLMELNFGDWELQTWSSIGKQAFDLWHTDFVNNIVPNGESYQDLYARTLSFWKEITIKKENAILISHGGFIRALLAHSLGLPLKNSFRLKIDHGSLSKITINEDFLTVDYVNRSHFQK